HIRSLLRGRLLLGPGGFLGLLRRRLLPRLFRLLPEDCVVARGELAVLGKPLTNDAHVYLRVVGVVWAYADQCNARAAGCHFPQAKRKRISAAGSSCARSIHSSVVCAWAMSPGPKTTAGTPVTAIREASVPNGTGWTVCLPTTESITAPNRLTSSTEPAGSRGAQPGEPCVRVNGKSTSGSARRRASSSAVALSNVSPGKSRRSTSARQKSGTVLGETPPVTRPTEIVRGPSTGSGVSACNTSA